MKIELPYLPERLAKPRENGLTMVMDKGLSFRQAEDFVEMCAGFTDLVKLGFGTAVLSEKLEQKIRLYHQAGIKTYLGGTLFEAFIIRNKFEDYMKLLDDLGIMVAEVSDGSMFMHHSRKLEYIKKLSVNFTVLSEVGSKQKGVEIPDHVWARMMESELEAGSWKVIAEARESGTTGIYHSDGTADVELISMINKTVDATNVLWEAPAGKQQVWFIKQLGCNVNLGNIAAQDVIPLECLRLGLRGDTFFDFLPSTFTDYRPESEKYQHLDS
ncbi:MAG: phosphosulfolactate synthase [Bacteroidales bacterium]|nr:phosphosulfolactate synthase [Bacteroidales bacterium]